MFRKAVNILIVVVIVALLAAYMFTYTVRYDEKAVVTRFGRVVNVQADPGLYFRLPMPIDSVARYSTNTHILESNDQQIRTRDNFSLVVKLECRWRVDDPAAFYRSFVDVETAERTLNANLLTVAGDLTRSYAFSDLVNTDPEALRHDQLQQGLTQRTRELVANEGKDYGIAIDRVSVTQLLLPEAASGQVFQTMIQVQQTKAESARSRGEADAERIRSRADAASRKLVSIAELAAEDVLASANREVGRQVALLDSFGELPALLEELRLLRESDRMTVFLNPEMFPNVSRVVNRMVEEGSGETTSPETGVPETGE